MTQNNVTIRLMKSDNWNQIYAMSAIGGHTPYDFKISFINDITEFHENGNISEVIRLIDTEVIMSPRAAKEMLNWLSNNVKSFEEKFGMINTNTPENTIFVKDGYKPQDYTSEVA